MHLNQTLVRTSHRRPIEAAPSVGASRRWASRGGKALVLIAMGVAAVLFRNPLMAVFQPPPAAATPPRDEIVSIAESSRHITVTPGSPLAARLKLIPVRRETIALPLLNVTGSVIARLAPGADHAEARWDFAAPDIAAAYSDWIKAKADVAFFEGQAAEVRKLAESRVEFATVELTRLENLLKIGTASESEVAKARTDKQQAIIQGRKDNFEADTAVRNAVRNRGLLERQLLQAGVDPDVLVKATDGLVLVVADVPETKIALLEQLIDKRDGSKNKPCRAQFFSHPDRPFAGRVGRVGPSLAKDKRTLRVTFELQDPDGRLLPGMFAEIGLGTQSRSVLTVPAEAVLHAGDQDYVLSEVMPGEYAVRTVLVDEPLPSSSQAASRGSQITVRRGLEEGERLVAAGAILLKPTLVKSLNGTGH